MPSFYRFIVNISSVHLSTNRQDAQQTEKRKGLGSDAACTSSHCTSLHQGLLSATRQGVSTFLDRSGGWVCAVCNCDRCSFSRGIGTALEARFFRSNCDPQHQKIQHGRSTNSPIVPSSPERPLRRLDRSLRHWVVDRLTRLPYTRFSSRLVDRLLISIEGGQQS